MEKLQGKVILVTGAASGMGHATTMRLEAEGAFVIACDRNDEVIQKWEGHENITALVANVTELTDVEKMISCAKEKYGRLDGVCNIAGVNDLSYPLLDTDDARWDRVMDIDLKAPFRIMRAAVPLMQASGGGSIVNIGSYAALRGNHGPSYTAAKAGLEGLTKSAAFRYGKDNIRCNIIHPGGCATNIGETSGGQYHAGQKELSALISAMPVKFYNGPNEIANVIAFLMSDEATWINGAAISVDGGMAVC